MNFPTIIKKYIEQNRIKKNDLSYLIASIEGVIIDVGNSAHSIIINPIVGQSASDFIPALEGIFPLKADVYLPNIQLAHATYFNIHLILLYEQVWVLLQDITKNIDVVKRHIEMKKEIKKYEFSLLEVLDYYVFKENGKGKFRPISGKPAWMKEITDIQTDKLDLVDLFPFLEHFLDQLPKGLISDEIIENYSGIWTKSTKNGSEMHLNAWAFQVLNDTFLLIHPFSKNASVDQNLIQLARENTLAYEQLEKTKNQLQDVLFLKDQFVNIVSHDFRSPIATLTDGLSFLLEDIGAENQFDNSHRDLIIQVKEELIRLLDYNNKLYNWTKYSLDSLELNITDVSLDLMIANLNGMFDARLNEKEIKLNLEVNESITLKTDYILLNQIVSNLLDNAIKFSKINSEIMIKVNQLFIEITDFGIGISNEKIEEIKKGYSLRSSKGTIGEVGTGLGLNIVTRIVHALNYNLDIKSEEGKGTTFKISF